MASELFETSEFQLVCTLVALGHQPFEEIVFNERGRGMFRFRSNAILDDIVDRFWASKLLVEPRKFVQVQNEIKDQIKYQKEKNGRN